MTRRTHMPVPLSWRALCSALPALCCVAALLSLAVLSLAAPAQAQRSGQDVKAFEGVKLEQKLGETLPGDVTLRNAAGEKVQLSRYFDGKHPVLLNFVYHECPMLCNLMVQGLTKTLRDMAWTPGDEFEVLTISFNHREGPALASEKKKAAVASLGKPEAAAGWHFLTGSKEAIRRLTGAAGFHFKWIEEKQEFAHPTALAFLSGDGTITRYLFGMNPSAGDTRKALVEASDGQVGSVVDQIALRCFQYDPESNSYVADAFNLMRMGSLLFAVLVGAALVVFWRRENDRQGEAPDSAVSSGDESSGARAASEASAESSASA